MCVVSMVGEHYEDKFNQPDWKRFFIDKTPIYQAVTIEEFQALKKQVEEMKALLIKAKIYDEKNNEPNCEMESKVALLKKMAEIFGVNLSEVFGTKLSDK